MRRGGLRVEWQPAYPRYTEYSHLLFILNAGTAIPIKSSQSGEA